MEKQNGIDDQYSRSQQPLTGEEDESILYSQRAQLLHFYDSEWHRRGIGQVKILKNKCNGKLRVVMRHEDINEPVCLNHILNEDVHYKVKTSNAWCFAVNDYSEGEYEIRRFCLRFKTSDIANNFKAAVDDILSNSPPAKHTSQNIEAALIVEDVKTAIDDILNCSSAEQPIIVSTEENPSSVNSSEIDIKTERTDEKTMEQKY